KLGLQHVDIAQPRLEGLFLDEDVEAPNAGVERVLTAEASVHALLDIVRNSVEAHGCPDDLRCIGHSVEDARDEQGLVDPDELGIVLPLALDLLPAFGAGAESASPFDVLRLDVT